MGGGDLNLKKSWHPSTMKNMEKVWKAEQKNDQEKKRIAELQRELQEERAREDMKKFAEDQGVIEKKSADAKLDWMYKGPSSSIDCEEYLLGKSIDKNFEQLQRAEQQNASSSISVPGRTDTCLPSSIFAGGGEQVDMARKLQEDPLYAIRKKEIETRSQILKNPVKLKRLQKLLKDQKSKKSKKHKKEKKRKRSKKQKKHGVSSDSSGESDSDLDAQLLARYQKLKEKLGDVGLSDLKNMTAASSSTKGEDQEPGRKRTSSSSHSEEDYPPKNKLSKGYGLQLHPSAKTPRRTSQMPEKEKETSKEKAKEQASSRPQAYRPKKLSQEDLERRRQEMMSNAAWRERERESNVARYREAERKDQSQPKEFREDFMRKQLSKATADSSVASRIKANINNIQRSGGAMDRNFARR